MITAMFLRCRHWHCAGWRVPVLSDQAPAEQQACSRIRAGYSMFHMVARGRGRRQHAALHSLAGLLQCDQSGIGNYGIAEYKLGALVTSSSSASRFWDQLLCTTTYRQLERRHASELYLVPKCEAELQAAQRRKNGCSVFRLLDICCGSSLHVLRPACV